ncbi:MAG TPA: hypothetical protein ENI07_00320 [Desulfobacterales bacterium]|nr:hypothetical protein [Desulfobacterales bacterium]
MKKTVEYLIEYKGPGKRRYSRTFTSFKDKKFALKLAAQSDCIRTGIVSARVVEQRRKIIKVFPAKKHGGGVITPAASGDKGKVDITAMKVDVDERKSIDELLQLIRGEGKFGSLGKGITSYPNGDENNQNIHSDCLELERRRLIYRHYISECGSIVWMAT